MVRDSEFRKKKILIEHIPECFVYSVNLCYSTYNFSSHATVGFFAMKPFFGILSAFVLSQCNASASCSAAERLVWFNNVDFSNYYDACARKTNGLSVRSKTVECLASKYREPDMTRDCLVCFGEAANCGLGCALPCRSSSSAPRCLTCMERKCFGSLMQCVGAETKSELPLPPRKAWKDDVDLKKLCDITFFVLCLIYQRFG